MPVWTRAVRSPIRDCRAGDTVLNPQCPARTGANWFLNPSTDVRSSYHLEDVASEFLVQGLELDWVGVCWDGDFHHKDGTWHFQSFKGTKWQSINDASRLLYLKNAYRVILTRARQGMILFVPTGDASDRTRLHPSMKALYECLRACGIPEPRIACILAGFRIRNWLRCLHPNGRAHLPGSRLLSH